MPLAIMILLTACAESTRQPDLAVSATYGIEMPPTSEESASDNEPSFDEDRRKRGGMMRLFTNYCTIPDPAIDRASAGLNFLTTPLVWEIHAGLMRVVDDPAATSRPELAASYSLKDDGRRYEFVDLKFSDGSPLTAKWSWTRALAMSTGASRANEVLGSIEGAEDVALELSDDLIGIEVVDDRTVSVALTRATPDFPALLGDPIASVLKRGNVLTWGMKWNNADSTVEIERTFNHDTLPVGAGPFQLIEYRSSGNDRCALKRNEHHWDCASYLLDGVVYATDVLSDHSESPDDFEAIENTAFENGIIDYAYVYPDVAERVRSGDEMIYGKLQPIDREPFIGFLAFNPSLPPYDDLHFRRALVASANVSRIFQDASIPVARRLLPSSMRSEDISIESLGYDLKTHRMSYPFPLMPTIYITLLLGT